MMDVGVSVGVGDVGVMGGVSGVVGMWVLWRCVSGIMSVGVNGVNGSIGDSILGGGGGGNKWDDRVGIKSAYLFLVCLVCEYCLCMGRWMELNDGSVDIGNEVGGEKCVVGVSSDK